jgi:hypothetical protein
MKNPVIRFLVTEYRRFVIAEFLVLVTTQGAAIVVHDLGITGLQSAGFDSLIALLSIGLFTVGPFALAFDATKRHGLFIPGTRARAGSYLGITLNALLGLASVLFGFLQAGLRQHFLNEPQATTSTYLLLLLAGLIFAVWLGGCMGWVGNRVAILASKKGM